MDAAITAARLEDKGRTLVLVTDPHAYRATYAVTLPHVRGVGRTGLGETAELDYRLNGVAVTWTEHARNGERPAWSGWWPHLDTEVVRGLTAGSAEHRRCLELLGRPGRLTLRTRLGLLHGKITLRLEASGAFEMQVGARSVRSVARGAQHRASIDLQVGDRAAEVVLRVTTGEDKKPLVLHAAYHTGSDSTERPLPLDSLVLPWAGGPMPSAPVPSRLPARFAGGDARRGEAIFFGEKARCSACHKIHGKGGDIGPDLSNLFHRNAASVYRDITEPSATLNPDYLSFTVSLKNGRQLAGLVRAHGEKEIKIWDTQARPTVVPRAEVAEIRPNAVSIMPAELVKGIGEAGVRDLLAFLLSPRAGEKSKRK